MEIEKIHSLFNKIQAKKSNLEESLNYKIVCVKEEKKELKCLVKARYVLIKVSEIMQKKFKVKVENLVNIAIHSVFDRPFKFILGFERRKNKLECIPYIEENGDKYIPKNDMGGGILPVISFALRIVLWSLEKPRSRNVIILDEPMIGVGSLIGRASQMIKTISKKLNIQIIMLTHSDELKEIADTVYKITHDGIQSNVQLIKNNYEKF